MSRLTVTVLVVASFCVGAIKSAAISDSVECPISSLMTSWNNTVENCVNEVVGEGNDKLCQTVTDFVLEMFNIKNSTDDSAEVDPSDDVIAKSFASYFCILQSVVQQSPKLAVMAFDCAKEVPSNVTNDCEKQTDITECFEMQLQQSCATMMNSRKRRSLISAIRL